MSKSFINITIQEKAADDWRAFCLCEDNDGDRWELRGYGKNPAEAAKDVYDAFKSDEWDVNGYMIQEADEIVKMDDDVKALNEFGFTYSSDSVYLRYGYTCVYIPSNLEKPWRILVGFERYDIELGGIRQFLSIQKIKDINESGSRFCGAKG